MLNVLAHFVDGIHIYVFCNNVNCSSKCHLYGSCGDLSNRVESRTSHCPLATDNNLRIHITNMTIRNSLKFYGNGTFSISKRKFNKSIRGLEIKPALINTGRKTHIYDTNYQTTYHTYSKNGKIEVTFT